MFNKFMVGVQGDNICIARPPQVLNKEDALQYVAMIIVMGNITREELDSAINEVIKD